VQQHHTPFAKSVALLNGAEHVVHATWLFEVLVHLIHNYTSQVGCAM